MDRNRMGHPPWEMDPSPAQRPDGKAGFPRPIEPHGRTVSRNGRPRLLELRGVCWREYRAGRDLGTTVWTHGGQTRARILTASGREADGMNRDEFRETLRELAQGKIQRSRHDLRVDGTDATEEFQAVLRECGYEPARIREISIPRGMRFPAWVFRESLADFGYVFKEKFSESEVRILFGSVVRDWRGDWEVMLTRRSGQPVWVNLREGVPFDEDRPSPGS
ncbi:MAG: hypothetical protein WBS54_12540 [Acidobacteriota bacterium]